MTLPNISTLDLTSFNSSSCSLPCLLPVSQPCRAHSALGLLEPRLPPICMACSFTPLRFLLKCDLEMPFLTSFHTIPFPNTHLLSDPLPCLLFSLALLPTELLTLHVYSLIVSFPNLQGSSGTCFCPIPASFSRPHSRAGSQYIFVKSIESLPLATFAGPVGGGQGSSAWGAVGC